MLKFLTKSVDFFKSKIYNEIVKKINKKEKRCKFSMRVNIEAVKKLIEERFRGNTSWFAEEIGMDATYVSTILNNPKKSTSDKFCNSLIKYCELHNLNFKEYIFLE
jgi:hypothetical protein